MNERICESISALMDDKANELELERVLSCISRDGELRQTWTRFHLAQDALHSHQFAHPGWDISQRVQSALAGVPLSVPQATGASFRERLWRPLTSLAVAASVTITVVIGGQKLAGVAETGSYEVERSVATSASPVGMLNSLGATAVQASYGTQSVPALEPATRTAYQQLAQQRLRRYMQQHAEQAALNTPQGLVPYARVPQIRQ